MQIGIIALGFAGLGLPELMILLVVILIVFGAGKLPKVMGQMGKGVKSFKDGMKGDEDVETKAIADNSNVMQTEEVVEAEEVHKAGV